MEIGDRENISLLKVVTDLDFFDTLQTEHLLSKNQ